MIYEQLLRAKLSKIPKAQKDTNDFNIFFAPLGSACIKAAQKNVGEIDPISLFGHLSFSMSVCSTVCLSICAICLFVHFSFFTCLTDCLSTSLSKCFSNSTVCLSICPFVHLSMSACFFVDLFLNAGSLFLSTCLPDCHCFHLVCLSVILSCFMVTGKSGLNKL